jgi:hypothetical protein
MRPRIGEAVKVMYRANTKPVKKVMGKTIRKAAICALIVIPGRIKGSLKRMKL